MTKWLPFRAVAMAALSVAMTVGAHAGGGTEDAQAPKPVVCGTDIMNAADPAEVLANTARQNPDVYHRIMAGHSFQNPFFMKRAGDDDVTWDFNVFNRVTSSYDRVTGVLKFIGQYVNIWVDQNATNVTPSVILQLARALDSTTVAASRNPKQGIIENDIDVFGPVPVNGWTGDHKTEFLLTDIKDNLANANVLGYFYQIDQDPNNPATNNMNILYIDSKEGLQGGLNSLLSTVAHEFQHLLHYARNQHSETMYNEGCSEDASILNGYMDRGNTQFMANTNVDLFMWRDNTDAVTIDYERAMTFIHYLQEQFGEQFLYALVGESASGLDRINNSLRTIGNSSNAVTTLENFAVANYLRLNADSRYGYKLPIKSSSQPKVSKTFTFANYPTDTSYYLERLGSLYLLYNNSAKLTEGVQVRYTGTGATIMAMLYQGTNIEVRRLEPGQTYILGGSKPYDKIVLALVNTSDFSQTLEVVSQHVALGVDQERAADAASFSFSNVPNPFMGSTMFHFTTPTGGPVSLKVFDARGQEVATVLDGARMEAGFHDVPFEANDLPDGYYVARLVQGDHIVTQSMVLLK
jgi:hypothetical protein